MSHLGNGLVWRVVSGQASEAEIDRLWQHALDCSSCRAMFAAAFEAAGGPSLKGEVDILSTLLRVADSEHERAIATLLATAEWSALRHLSRTEQQERVVRSRDCHSLPFVNVLLGQLRIAMTGDEAEFIASLAVQALTLIDQEKLGRLREDLQAQAWIEVANTRRREAKWRRAESALAQAERLFAKGTGDPLVEARYLSIRASLLSDQGQRSKALQLLQGCKKLYTEADAWSQLARTFVQEANVLVELIEPERALQALSQAISLARGDDAYLYAEILRATCFIETNRHSSALRVYFQTESLWGASLQKRIRLRSRFLAARLLEAFGRPHDAVRLFEEVIACDLDQEFFKDALLDLLYLFGVHLRIGDAEGAAAICRRALGQMEALGLMHEQLHAVWIQLLEAARTGDLDNQAILAVRDYMQVFWRSPAPQVPQLVHFREDAFAAKESKSQSYRQEGTVAADPTAATGIKTLLAAAEWSALKQRSRKAQHERVIRARICHSPSFVSVLIADLQRASSGDEAEFIASLALRAVNLIDQPEHGLREDLQVQVWCEVANQQRREAKWRRAEEALAQAEPLLGKGTGDALIEARFLSVRASLLCDLGRRSEAVAHLERCRSLFAEKDRWPMVARTLVQEANVLVELIEPEKALAALSQALPLIREEEIFLYAEILRATCFIETNRLPFALQVYLQTEPKWVASPQTRISLRGQFLGARLLEALGRHREAVRLFEAVIAADLRYEFFKDALLDLLYLFGLFVRLDDAEGAIAVCNRAIRQMKALDLGHEQLYAVWTQLMEMARVKALGNEGLTVIKEYLRLYWRYPAPQTPKLDS